MYVYRYIACHIHIPYTTRGLSQDQTFITTCKSMMIDFINLLINKGLKCVSFYDFFITFLYLANNFCYISLNQLKSAKYIANH